MPRSSPASSPRSSPSGRRCPSRPSPRAAPTTPSTGSATTCRCGCRASTGRSTRSCASSSGCRASLPRCRSRHLYRWRSERPATASRGRGRCAAGSTACTPSPGRSSAQNDSPTTSRASCWRCAGSTRRARRPRPGLGRCTRRTSSCAPTSPPSRRSCGRCATTSSPSGRTHWRRRTRRRAPGSTATSRPGTSCCAAASSSACSTSARWASATPRATCASPGTCSRPRHAPRSGIGSPPTTRPGRGPEAGCCCRRWRSSRTTRSRNPPLAANARHVIAELVAERRDGMEMPRPR